MIYIDPGYVVRLSMSALQPVVKADAGMAGCGDRAKPMLERLFLFLFFLGLCLNIFIQC